MALFRLRWTSVISGHSGHASRQISSADSLELKTHRLSAKNGVNKLVLRVCSGRQATNDKGVTISQPGMGNGEQGTVKRPNNFTIMLKLALFHDIGRAKK